MRRIFGTVAVAAFLWLAPVPAAQAQIGFGYPGYQSYYGGSYGYGTPYGYGGYGSYGGYGQGVSSYYSSGYSSAYVAPGTTYFNSGYYTPYGYGAPVIGVPAAGYGYGYGTPAVYGYGGLGSGSGYVSTGPFMGIPRPFAGLVRVPR